VPAIILLYWKAPKIITWALFFALTALSVALRWWLADEYHYKAVYVHQDNVDHFFWERFQIKPYTQWIPFFFGMMSGCLWINYKTSVNTDRIGNVIMAGFCHKYVSWVLFLLGVAAITPLVFSLMDAYAHYDNWNNA
jgi:hypothetical protein